MKQLSQPLGTLWEKEPNKPLWSMMAKAWSTIRDRVGKNQAPLDKFFSIICPYLEVPSPETYLERYGWTVIVNQEGGPKLARDDVSESASISAEVAGRTLSVEDIISYCQSMGYAQGTTFATNTTSPTFLTHCPMSQGSANIPAVQATAPTAGRLEARNRRRARRQTARETGAGLQLQEEIADLHAANGPDMDLNDDVNVVDTTSEAFYNHLAGLLVPYVSQMASANISVNPTNASLVPHQQASATSQTSTATTSVAGPQTDAAAGSITSNSNVPTLVGQSAFRAGADANATLPRFDPNNP